MKYALLSLLIPSALAHGTPTHVFNETAHVDVTTEKVAHIVGVIDDELARSFNSELDAVGELAGDTVVFIDSPGGSVDAGDQILARMEIEKDKGTHFVCVASEIAASMAFNILTHCDVRLATPGTLLLFHPVAIGDWPSSIRGTASNMRKLADLLDKVDAPFSAANAQALSMSPEDYKFYEENETRWEPYVLFRMGYLQGVTEPPAP